MIKYFCDVCHKKIQYDNSTFGTFRLELSFNNYILAEFSGTQEWNEGHVCHECKAGFVKAVNDVIEMMKVALNATHRDLDEERRILELRENQRDEI